MFSKETGAGAGFVKTVSDVSFRLFGRLLVSFPETSQLVHYPKQTIWWWGLLVTIVTVVCIAGIVWSLVWAFRNHKKDVSKYVLLALWLVVGIGLFGFYRKSIYDYYFGILFPLPFLLLTNVYAIFWGKGKIVRSILLAVLLGFVLLAYFERPIQAPGNAQLAQVKGIAEFVLSKTDGKPYNFAVISAGGNSDYAYRYFFETEGRPPVTIQYPGADPKRTSITDQLLIVCESVPCEPRGYSLWEVAGFGQAEIAGEWPVSVVKVYRLVHYKEK